MSIRRLEILVGGLLAGLGVVLGWHLLSKASAPPGGVSVSLVGFTNAASGEIAGQFAVSNAFGYPLVVSAAAPQIRRSNRWSQVSLYGYPGNPVFRVAPHSAQTFAVTLSNVDGAAWRVPLAYDKIKTRTECWSEDIKMALRLPVPANPVVFTNSPEIFGLSDYTVQRTGASHRVEETNPTSSVAGSRR